MGIYSKSEFSKRYVSFTSSQSKHCLENNLFSLARIICIITEKDYLKEMKLILRLLLVLLLLLLLLLLSLLLLLLLSLLFNIWTG